MFPYLFKLSLSLIIIYYLFFFGTLSYFIILISLLIIISFFKYKKLFSILIFSILYYIYLSISTKKHINNNELILNGKKFFGLITKRSQNKNFFLYHIILDFYFIENKKIKNKSSIIVMSKNSIPEGSYVYIPYIFFLNQNNENNFTSIVGISKYVKATNAYEYKLIYKPIQYILKIKEKLQKYINTYFDEKEKLFFETIFLGKSMNNNSQNNKILFNYFGITHYLARSGLHIQIILESLLIIFLFIGLSYKTIIIIQMIFLLFFYFISFPSISFFRSIMMFLLYGIATINKKQTTSLHTISIVTIITLFIYPFAFLNLSTQLTFLTTTILCLQNYIK